MKLFTTINEYKKYLFSQTGYEIINRINEEIDGPNMNSDKAIELSRYEKDMNYFEENKKKLDSVLSISEEEEQEVEANKIIQGNKYLGLYWKHIKAMKKSDSMEERLNDSELTEEEKQNMRQELNDLQADMVLTKRNLEQSIKNDIKDIKSK